MSKQKNPRVLQKKINDLYEAYSHAIRLNYVSFNNAFAMIQGYDTNAKIEGMNKGMLMAGLMANNLFFLNQKKKRMRKVENHDDHEK